MCPTGESDHTTPVPPACESPEKSPQLEVEAVSVPELQSGQLKDTDIVKYLKQGSRDDLDETSVAEEEDSGTDIELEVTEDPERTTSIMDSVRIQAKPPRSKSRSPMKRIKKFFKGSSSKDQDKTTKYLQGVDTSRYYQVKIGFKNIGSTCIYLTHVGWVSGRSHGTRRHAR